MENRKATIRLDWPARLLLAGGPFFIGAGLTLRFIVSHRAPLVVKNQLDRYSLGWTAALVALCFAATVLSLLERSEIVTKIEIAVRLLLTFMILGVAVAWLFRNPDVPPATIGQWWATRDYTTVGVILSVDAFMAGTWWMLTSHVLPSIHTSQQLQRRYRDVLDQEER